MGISKQTLGRYGTPRTMARGLGWFSIGLGAAELLMPRAVSRAAGMNKSTTLVRFYGLREIATGVGLLNAKDPTPWLWARVGGDALDLATVGMRSKAGLPGSMNSMMSMAALAAVTLADLASAQASTSASRSAANPPPDYSNRSGFPRPASEMRGAASKDFKAPDDMKVPKPLAPLTQAAA